MDYLPNKRELILNKELSELDFFVLKFTSILKKYVDYVIISGYVSILLGRSRATEDIDIFVKRIDKNKFIDLYNDLNTNGFWCINSDDVNALFSYLSEGVAIRFAKKGTAIPNFEVKFAKIQLEEETFNDILTVRLKGGELIIPSLERQIAFKRYFLKSDKDEEDALHIETLFKDQLDHSKINKFKVLIETSE